MLVGKYCDHLPLFRHSEIYARADIELERSIRTDGVGECVALLDPLIERIGAHVFADSRLHADPVLSPGLARTKTGRLRTSMRDDRPVGGNTPPAALFRFASSSSQKTR